MRITDDGKYLKYSTKQQAEVAENKVFENYVRHDADARQNGRMYNGEENKWSDEWRVVIFSKNRYKIVGKRDGVDNFDDQALTHNYAEVKETDIPPKYHYIPKPVDQFMPNGPHVEVSQEELNLSLNLNLEI